MLALRLLFYSLISGILLYLTIVVLPETINLPESISKMFFFAIMITFFIVSEEKWWVKLGALLLGVVVFMAILILFSVLTNGGFNLTSSGCYGSLFLFQRTEQDCGIRNVNISK